MDKVFEIYRSFSKQEENMLYAYLKNQHKAQSLVLQLHSDICYYREIDTLPDLLARRKSKYKTLPALKKNASLLRQHAEDFALHHLIQKTRLRSDTALLEFFLARNMAKNATSQLQLTIKNFPRYDYETKLHALELQLNYHSMFSKGGSLGDEFLAAYSQKLKWQDAHILEIKLKEMCVYQLYSHYRPVQEVRWKEMVHDVNDFMDHPTILLLYKVMLMQDDFTVAKGEDVLRLFDQHFDEISTDNIGWLRFLLGNFFTRQINLRRIGINDSIQPAYYRFVYKRFFNQQYKSVAVHANIYHQMFHTALEVNDKAWAGRLLGSDLLLLPREDRTYVKHLCLLRKHYWENDFKNLWQIILKFEPRTEHDKTFIKSYQMICLYEEKAFDTLYDNIRSEKIRLKREKHLASVKHSFVRFLEAMDVLISKPSFSTAEKKEMIVSLQEGVVPYGYKWLLEKFGG